MKSAITTFAALGLVALLTGVAEAARVGQWTFDNVSGSTVVNDGSLGSAGDGTLNGGATIVGGGVAGNCVSLDGGDGYVSVPDNAAWEFPAGQSFSISLWFKTTATPYAYQGLVTKNYGGTSPGSSYLLTDVWNNAGVGGQRVITDGDGADNGYIAARWTADDAWHAITFVRDSDADEFLIYLDVADTYVQTGIADVAFGVNSADLLFGRRINAAYSVPFTQGSFDEINFFDHALSPSEVAALHNPSAVAGTVVLIQ